MTVPALAAWTSDGVAHAADVHALMVGGGAGNAGIPVAEGGGDAPAGHRPDVAAQGRAAGAAAAACWAASCLGQLDDLCLDGLLLRLNGVQRGLILALIGSGSPGPARWPRPAAVSSSVFWLSSSALAALRLGCWLSPESAFFSSISSCSACSSSMTRWSESMISLMKSSRLSRSVKLSALNSTDQ